jgi:type 1 glutamine amidotransferase/HEAT repeat protein
MTYRNGIILFFVLSFLARMTAQSQIPPDEIQKIDQAIPSKPIEKPDHPRRLLVFTLSEGFKHDAIPYAAKMLELMGKKTGAFEIVQGDDMALFKPESLRRFDAVCFDNTTQLKFEDPSLRQALMDFVKGGKGIIGIHAATDNFYTWPEAAAMMGGTFDGHPWTADGTWKVEIEDPAHPLMASFHGQGFSIRDEIYRTKQIDLRKTHRVLMGLDMKDEHNRSAAGVRNSDKDIPISWIGTVGQGRMFYCSLGHNREVYWNPAVVRHYLAGIQYALGDLQADATPLPFNASAFFDQKELDRLLNAISSYTYGQSKEPMQDLDAFVRYVSDLAGAQEKLEQQFLAVLRSDATPAGKQFICSRLGHIGTGASVPTLVGMLADSATWEMALFALEYLSGDAVNDSLCHALPDAQGRMKCGVINALGRRHATGAVAAIQPYLAAGDEDVAVAAAAALGEIGDPAAAQALSMARQTSRGALLLKILDGSLKCAERFSMKGDKAHALRIYEELQTEGQPLPVRLAALRGTVLLEPQNAGTLVVQALQDSSSYLRSGAMQLVREVHGRESIRGIVAQFESLPPVGQVQLLSALDDRPDPEVFAAMVNATKSKQPEVREAALKALAKTGNASAARIFVQAATHGSAAERRIARDGLATLSGSATNDTLVAMLPASDASARIELMIALAARKVTASTPVLLREANDRNPAVRTAAAKALRSLAQPGDLPDLVSLLVNAKGGPERKEWETTVVAVARKDSDPARKVGAIVSAYSSTKGAQARIALLAVAARIDAPASLEMLRNALNDNDPEERLTAIRGLSRWPTPEPVDNLWEVAQHAGASTHRAVALRGVVHLLGLESNRSADETVAFYRRALAQAPKLEERKRLLSSMADARVPASLQFASGCIDDPKLHGEAELVTVRIAENIIGSHKEDVVLPLTKVVEHSKNPTAVQRAKELLTLASQFEEYLTTWEYAGPYMKEGAQLMSTVFPPEEENAVDVQWKPFPAGTNAEKPWLLEFDKVIGGENRVVYLRNKIWSDSARSGILEVGSDDGIKIWVNGDERLVRDVERSVHPGDDQVDVPLQQGWNTMLVKVTQRGGPWGACIKLRAPNDTPKLKGIRVARVTE